MNPHLLPKVRSRALLDACADMNCTIRIASFLPGYGCAPQSTVVACHIGNLGKGTGTKVSDMNVAAGCLHCHDLVDRRDSRMDALLAAYPVAVMERMMLGIAETQAQWVGMGLLTVKGMAVV
jgi:hypothetical protein